MNYSFLLSSIPLWCKHFNFSLFIILRIEQTLADISENLGKDQVSDTNIY